MNCFIVFSLISTLLLVANAWEHEEHHPMPYKFAYGVSDHHTGDHHQQHEVSDGHVVKGSYSLKEADGTTRIVDYIAGPHTGFNAVVRRIGHAHHPQHYGHHEHGAYGKQGGYEQESYGEHEPAQSYIATTHWGHDGYGEQGGYKQQSYGGHGKAESYIGTTHWGFNY